MASKLYSSVDFIDVVKLIAFSILVYILQVLVYRKNKRDVLMMMIIITPD